MDMRPITRSEPDFFPKSLPTTKRICQGQERHSSQALKSPASSETPAKGKRSISSGVSLSTPSPALARME
eukprot:152804-Pyramimonas_sp.AAC.1